MKNRISIKIKHGGCAVYLLKWKGTVVYVGKSAYVLHRFAGHRRKIFDEVVILWMQEHLLSNVEAHLIRVHKPKLNAEPQKPLRHGTLSAYMFGCRCSKCKTVKSIYQRGYRNRKFKLLNRK